MEDRSLRAVRGWMGALFSTSLAAASHALADGALPPLPVLGLVLVISAAICTAMAGPKNSLLRTTLAVVLSQGTYHLIFSFAGNSPANGLLSNSGAHAGHHTVNLNPVRAELLAATPESLTAAMAWMQLAHVAAALATIAVLRRGESALRALLFVLLLGRPVRVLFARLPILLPSPRLTSPSSEPGPLELFFTLGALLRRGPPLRLAF